MTHSSGTGEASALPLTIGAIRVTPVVVPLDRPITTASGKVDRAPLVLIDLDTKQGVTGRAYLFAYFLPMISSPSALTRLWSGFSIGGK